jgi:CRP/FNR family transcriptional regulator, cyclic AMP receptor protein
MLDSGASPPEHVRSQTMEATELLKQTPLFDGLSDADIEELAQSTRIQDYKAGQIIVIEGRVGAAFFILVSGNVEVIKRRGQSDEAVLAILEAGDFFGELATMRHVQRSATIRALQDCRCLVIRRADFEAYISKFPDVVAKVESTLTSRFGEVPDLDD